MRGGESHLLDLGEVVLCVFVQDQLAYFPQGELFLRPHVRQVEDVYALFFPRLLCFLRGHGLYGHRPGGVVACFDGGEEVFLRVVGPVAVRVLLRDELGALVGLEVDLGVDPLAVFVD